MMNLVQVESEARRWGITLRERFELEAHIRDGLKPLDKFTDEDRKEEDFRGKVSDVLIANRLFAKAARYIECSRFGFCLECEGEQHHRYFSPVYCDLRFCPRCGARMFARLSAKYAHVVSYVKSHPKRGFQLRELTLTCKNTGSLDSETIKKFNEDVKRTLKILMKGVQAWGAIWCDEVGFNNFNLHAHILFYGPYIEQARLAEAWEGISGNRVVWVRKAHTCGPLALQHLLKYVSKPPADKPEIIGQLEVAFHGRRRVHTLGIFYNFAGDDPDNLENEWERCPECGAELRRLPGTYRIEELALQGLKFIGECHPRGGRKQWVN